MANGWLPRTGEEWMRWTEQELRILRRHRHVNYIGEWPDAVDGSSGVDTEPEDEYVDDTPGDYVEPTEFTDQDVFPGGEVPDTVETFIEVP